jgi:S-(hydroxymethyl)glutathione dehydrogenase / alcohol dehydrogenase
MKTTAAILVELGQPLELVELEIPPLKPGQVLVEIAYSGVCHTQVLEARGHRGEDRFLPHCLGHEGSGIVREISEGVTKVAPGDPAILSWIKGSGMDVPGTVYDWNGRAVNAGGITTFSQYAVIAENRLTPLPCGIDMKAAALIGCAIATGAGAVLNAAQAQAAKSLAVFGIGGVGLCAVTAAALSGCSPIIAIDLKPEKLALARQMGATETIEARETDVVAAINALCPGGVDYAIEATGRPPVMLQALASVRAQGGAAVIVGNAHFGERLEIDPRQLNQGKKLLGTWGGDSVPDRDYPRYCELIASGRLNLQPMLSPPYALSAINQALDDLEAALVVRPIIEMTDGAE